MPIYSFYRIVKDIIRTIFGGKFWRKFLIIILISIAIWFILHDKGYCYDTTMDLNYQAQSYYDGLMSDFIFRLNTFLNVDNQYAKDFINDINGGKAFYLYWGNLDGSSYVNGQPVSRSYLQVLVGDGSNILANRTELTSDYMSLETYTMFSCNYVHTIYRFSLFDGLTKTNYANNEQTFYFPLKLFNYRNSLFTEYINAYNSGDTQAILDLLNTIKGQNDTILEEMTQDVQDTSQGVVDTSIVDTSGTQQATQNVQSLLNIIKGFYDNIGDEVYTISFPIRNTSFTIRSDIISSHISGTWLATFLNTFWYFIFGMYYLIFLFRIGKWLADGSLFEERRCSQI